MYQSKYFKYKKKYIMLKKQLAGAIQQFGEDSNDVKKIKAQINLINIILYSQFSYLKRNDYIDYCKRNIWHYINYIPGKYFSNKINYYPGKLLTNENKLTILYKNKNKIIVGWGLPKEQRIHNYKLKTTTICTGRIYNSYPEKYYEIDLSNSKKTPNYYLLETEPRGNWGSCQDKYISKIELYYDGDKKHEIEINYESSDIEDEENPTIKDRYSGVEESKGIEEGEEESKGIEGEGKINKLINKIDRLIEAKEVIFNENLKTKLSSDDKKIFLEDNKPKYINLKSYETNDDILEINRYIRLLGLTDENKEEFLNLFYKILFTFCLEKKIEFNELHKEFNKEINDNKNNFEYTLSKINNRMTLLDFINNYDNIIDITQFVEHISVPKFMKYKDLGEDEPKDHLFRQVGEDTIFLPEERKEEELKKAKEKALEEAEKDNFYRKFCYFYDHMSNSIIVSIAGTDNMDDWLKKNLNAYLSILYTGDGREDEYEVEDKDILEPTENDGENFSDIKNFEGYAKFPLLITHQGFTQFAKKIFKEICIKNAPDDCIAIEDTTTMHLNFKDNFCKFTSNKLRDKFNKNYPEVGKKPLFEFYNKLKEKLSEDKKESLQITFTGHSLGSATALCLYLLCYFDKEYKALRDKMKFVGLSSPRLNHIYTIRNFKKYVNEDKIIHIYHTGDIVTKMPHFSSDTSRVESWIPRPSTVLINTLTTTGALAGATAAGITTIGSGATLTPFAPAIAGASAFIATEAGHRIVKMTGLEDTSEETRIKNAKSTMFFHGGNLLKINTNPEFKEPKVNYYNKDNSILLDDQQLNKVNYNIKKAVAVKEHFLKNIIKPLSEVITTEPGKFDEGKINIESKVFWKNIIYGDLPEGELKSEDDDKDGNKYSTDLKVLINQFGGRTSLANSTNKTLVKTEIYKQKNISNTTINNTNTSKINENNKFIKMLDKLFKKHKIIETINNLIINENKKDLDILDSFISKIGLDKPENLIVFLEKLIEIYGKNAPISLVYLLIDLKTKFNN